MDRLDRYTCEEALKRLDDYLDRELAEDEFAAVRQHLELREHCPDQRGERQVGSGEVGMAQIGATGVPSRHVTAVNRGAGQAGARQGAGGNGEQHVAGPLVTDFDYRTLQAHAREKATE